jgi:hypothetical protein
MACTVALRTVVLGAGCLPAFPFSRLVRHGIAQRFTRAAKGQQGQAEQHWASEAQQTLRQLAPCGQCDFAVGEDRVVRNAYSRLVQYETGRGGFAKPTRWNAIAKIAVTTARQARARHAREIRIGYRIDLGSITTPGAEHFASEHTPYQQTRRRCRRWRRR